MPKYIKDRQELLNVVWEKSRGMDRDQTRDFGEAFAKCFSLLKIVSKSVTVEDMMYEISARFEK